MEKAVESGVTQGQTLLMLEQMLQEVYLPLLDASTNSITPPNENNTETPQKEIQEENKENEANRQNVIDGDNKAESDVRSEIISSEPYQYMVST